MGSFAGAVISLLLGWLSTAVSSLWSFFFEGQGAGLWSWIAGNWLAIAILICLAGTAMDVIIHLIRWRPLTVYAGFFRRMRRRRETAEEAPQEAEQPEAAEETVIARKTPVLRDNPSQTAPARDADAPAWTRKAKSPIPAAASPVPQGAEAKESAAQYAPRYEMRYSRPEADPPPAEITLDAQDAPAPAEAEKTAETRAERLRRRMAALPRKFVLSYEDDELDLRYKPPTLNFRQDQTYNSPVYPSGWKDDRKQ